VAQDPRDFLVGNACRANVLVVYAIPPDIFDVDEAHFSVPCYSAEKPSQPKWDFGVGTFPGDSVCSRTDHFDNTFPEHSESIIGQTPTNL
jgi:hypothetical protein